MELGPSGPRPARPKPVSSATMSSDEVFLRPVAEDDLPLLHRCTRDPSATGPFEWYGWQDPERFRRRWEQDRLLGEDGGMLIIADGEHRLGFVSWRKRQGGRISYYWTMGVAVAPEARGRGVGTQAQRQLVRYLFTHTLANRVEAATEIGNIAEQRALEKAGFTTEGVLRGVAFQGGRWHDGALYSVLRAEVDLTGPGGPLPA